MLGVRFFFFGCNNSFCGCNISFCSYNISFCGCNISFCGYNISFCGCNISFFGCNISFFDCNISFCGYNNSFCGYNISFCGYNISFCGCNNSKSDCYILFSACSKSKRDLCFSYATTYNLVDAFLSFKVLHETDAQRFVACTSVVVKMQFRLFITVFLFFYCRLFYHSLTTECKPLLYLRCYSSLRFFTLLISEFFSYVCLLAS